ncbi:MAG: hypothetical protein MUO51_07555 [Woeseiaceae bacterium]|nr:hypothetical protein [Woeseiaceae bacterium]
MGRVLTTAILLAVLTVTATAAEIVDGHEAVFGIDAGYLSMSGHPSWTEGSVGKLRYQDDGVVLNRAFVDYNGRVADTLKVHIALEGYDDNLGSAIDFTQAYVEWRPLPKSDARYRLKLGAFYPRISLENVDPGWSSRYTLNSSAINTWVAEELRSTGAEFTISRRPASLGGAHTFSVNLAAFIGNDPAGSLLAWKGWSVHDRQSRFSDDLPLPPLPQIQPGMMFEAQDPYVEPFQEIDNKVGYYLNAEWQLGKKLLVRAMHYDNRAEPTAIEQCQYAWKTIFNHIGVQTTLPGDVGLITQWMTGSTVMGPVIDSAHAVDVEYAAYFALLTRTFDQHRVSVRYDHFDVSQNDETEEDDNSENGHAWTLSYQYSYSDTISLATEWLSIKTHHYGWVYYGLAPMATERQFQLTLRVRF